MNKLRYNNFNLYLKDTFGCKVYKLPIDAGFTCPNRLKGTPCTYCDPSGSGTGASVQKISVRDQIESGIERYRAKYKAEKFIAYFQAFSNTYKPVQDLKELYDIPFEYPDIVGLSIGTRPDCVDKSKLDLIESYAKEKYVWVEYGMQSANDKTLRLIRRGHTFADLKRAVEMTQGRGIRICLHVILGLPGETRADMLHTAQAVAQLKVDGVKIHLLHIVKHSALEQPFLDGNIQIMDQDIYVETVCDFLEIIPSTILVQRLTGERHPDILVAPKWCLNKTHVIDAINAELNRRDSYQGKLCGMI
ncbi:MAG: TIGR01212 family radical SAM protein [Candidatus Auribacterota bacterium]|jgi:radical SAM protein (TIGR01212 family)|nr:TIGR01212 family radical SAM protein [Candidatus Auribacterota bacterium]